MFCKNCVGTVMNWKAYGYDEDEYWEIRKCKFCGYTAKFTMTAVETSFPALTPLEVKEATSEEGTTAKDSPTKKGKGDTQQPQAKPEDEAAEE